MSLDIRPLAETFVAEVVDIDVTVMSNSETTALHQAYLDHKVLVIRGQTLEAAEFARFAELFGEPVTHPVKNFQHPDIPEVMILSNSTRHGKQLGVRDAGSFWHSDRSYKERTADATMLYSLEIPNHGGNTFFADLEAIYTALPNRLRERIEGRSYLSHYRWTTNRGDPESRWVMLDDEERASTPPVVRPMVRTHPVTGRKSLFVFPGISAGVRGVIGMGAVESAELLDEIFDFMCDERFQYEHRWTGPGTVVVWDNRCVMHRATTKTLPPEKTRTLYRISTLGGVPN
jgi:taurine dioxygenase